MSDKTVSVELKIMDGFKTDDYVECIYRIRCNGKEWQETKRKVMEIIESKTQGIYGYTGTYFIAGENSQTIIEALWEYQKTECRKRTDKELYLVDNDTLSYRFKGQEEEYINFYNPSTRIITLTKFSEVSNDENS